MKKILSFFTLMLICAIIPACLGGEKCLPNKNVGDVVKITRQTLGAMDRSTYNHMMEAAKNSDNATTMEMLLAGQLRVVKVYQRGTLKDKDGTRALVLMPDDNKSWWINADFLE